MYLLGVLKRFIDWHGRIIFKENKRCISDIEPNKLIHQLDTISSKTEKKVILLNEEKFDIVKCKTSRDKYTFIKKISKFTLFFSVPKYKIDVEINVEDKTVQLLFRLKGVFRWQNIAFFIATEVVVLISFIVLIVLSVSQSFSSAQHDISYFSLLVLFALLFVVLVSVYAYYQIAVYKEKYIMGKVEAWISQVIGK